MSEKNKITHATDRTVEQNNYAEKIVGQKQKTVVMMQTLSTIDEQLYRYAARSGTKLLERPLTVEQYASLDSEESEHE